jgi:hypothetical protein
MIVVALAVLLLGPSLAYLYRLVLRRTRDQTPASSSDSS